MWWGYWKDYPKVRIGAREYAQIGNRLYTEHAVNYFQPSGRRTIANIPRAQGEGGGFISQGRGIPPIYIEDAIKRGVKRQQWTDGVQRTVHMLGDLEVITEQDGRVVVTVSYRH
jgi:filamentous hemagglutinin